ncbi:retrograde regulation protein [Rhizoctonia solani AG-3 Rhs1AP]|uniref:Retrograde regulation protein n=1 Tax=Rhizoctonia solani AG-3 Rhs1AP TaxID=1086054 RepID=X8JDZ4_9AGAM|nr:retrograde regulation protein [Rhizoctonia solani AG-3 Rhs1AP]
MAFYISQPKVRQAGFEVPNKQNEERQASPTYDPSMYFAHNNFGSPFDAFNRLKYADSHASVDFTDTLASMISESDARNAANGTPHPTFTGQPQPNPFDPHQFPHASSGHPILSPTGSAFSPTHGFPASAPTTSHPSFFDGADYAFLRGGTDRADTPSLASPTTADSPFSTTAPPLTATAPSKRGSGSAASRSRSRGPAAASTSRSRARKRASISSPSPPPTALIPSQNAWYIPTHGSHNDSTSSFGFASSLAMAGASPKSLGAKVSMAEDLAVKQAQLLSEKRRRRRESHNAVERRRRDNINEKISELSTLIPECLLSENPAAASKDDILGAVDEEGTREGPKANKGMILRKSVDYIKYLQQLVRAQASRNRELESQLSHYRGPTAGSDANDNPATLLPLLGTGHPATSVDLSNLVPIEDEDMVMSPSAVPALNSELSNQIIATIENRPEMDPLSDEDEEEEDERGRRAMRASRFGRGVSASVERVDEVDESALSDGSGKMED